jgi:hypothetical protein
MRPRLQTPIHTHAHTFSATSRRHPVLCACWGGGPPPANPPPPHPQVQYSLLDRRPRVAMADYCAANGIGLLPYGVLGGSFLTDKLVTGRPWLG